MHEKIELSENDKLVKSLVALFAANSIQNLKNMVEQYSKHMDFIDRQIDVLYQAKPLDFEEKKLMEYHKEMEKLLDHQQELRLKCEEILNDICEMYGYVE